MLVIWWIHSTDILIYFHAFYAAQYIVSNCTFLVILKHFLWYVVLYYTDFVLRLKQNDPYDDKVSQ